MLNSGKIVLILRPTDICNYFICQVFESLSSVKYYPLDSTKLGIFAAKNISPEQTVLVRECDILFKCVRLPFKDYHVCLPLFHTIK